MSCAQPDLESAPRRDRLVKWSAVSFGAAWAYILAVFFLGERAMGITVSSKQAIVILVVGAGLIWAALRAVLAWNLLSRDLVSKTALACGAAMFCLIAIDVAAMVYFPSPVADESEERDQRLTDANAWIGEWYPRLYYPTAQNFRIHKPNFTLAGEHYGNFYRPELLRSPTLRSSVLEKQRVTMRINELGFRETESLEECGIFALGDSFAFGWGVSDGQVWTDLLGQAIGKCVYNLGIHDASPRQELLLLADLLSGNRGRVPIRHLLWLVYDGNDLEDSYAARRPAKLGQASDGALDGTVIKSAWESIHAALYALKRESVIYRLKTGELTLGGASAGDRGGKNGSNPYEIDGVRLLHPLHFSATHGYSFFYRPYVERAAKPKSYLERHPHKPLLDRTFKEMSELAREHNFKVTVVVVPTSNRLYAPYYDLERVTREPFFIRHIEELSRAAGFDAINLLTALQPHLGGELLYFRDDDHWNARGQRVVAEIIKDHLSKSLQSAS